MSLLKLVVVFLYTLIFAIWLAINTIWIVFAVLCQCLQFFWYLHHCFRMHLQKSNNTMARACVRCFFGLLPEWCWGLWCQVMFWFGHNQAHCQWYSSASPNLCYHEQYWLPIRSVDRGQCGGYCFLQWYRRSCWSCLPWGIWWCFGIARDGKHWLVRGFPIRVKFGNALLPWTLLTSLVDQVPFAQHSNECTITVHDGWQWLRIAIDVYT